MRAAGMGRRQLRLNRLMQAPKPTVEARMLQRTSPPRCNSLPCPCRTTALSPGLAVCYHDLLYAAVYALLLLLRLQCVCIRQCAAESGSLPPPNGAAGDQGPPPRHLHIIPYRSCTVVVVVVALQVPAVVIISVISLRLPHCWHLHASCRPPSVPPCLYHCHHHRCHVAHPVSFDSPPSLPSCHARPPSNLPYARTTRLPLPFSPAPARPNSRLIVLCRARTPPETAETASCPVRSSALSSQIVNTRPLRSPALLSCQLPGNSVIAISAHSVLREGNPYLPRTRDGRLHGCG